MTLTPLVKACLTVVSVLGIGSAIGVPLSLVAKNKIERFSSETPGGGVEQVSISMCKDPTNSDGAAIDFGSQQKGNVCGSIGSDNGAVGDSEKYTALFREKWGESQKSGSNSSKQGSEGKSVCGLSGVVSTAGSGEEYLGICNGDKGEKTLFVKKVVTETQPRDMKSVKLSVCYSNCFQSKPRMKDFRLPEELEHPVQQEWIDVTFKMENKSKDKLT